MRGITIAVVGLGFGRAFVPIYLAHPDVAEVVLVEPDADRRADVAREYGIGPGYPDLDSTLGDDSIDAVHILAPVMNHADMVSAVLRAGKHVASAVPMATTLADLDGLISAQVAADRNYMMMETTVFAREYRQVAKLHRSGAFGSLTLYKGYHVQNLDGFPIYWQGFPPMHYVTHALSPLLSLLATGIKTVQCRGAGTLRPDRTAGGFDNPFPTEVGLFTLHESDVLAEVTLSFFQTARSYIEGFSLYGERLGVEWPIDNEGPLTLHEMDGPRAERRGNVVSTRSLAPADDTQELPNALRRFTRPFDYHRPGMPGPVHVSAQHGGSHPFLVHEFVRSIVERRSPVVDARTAARWTAPGICAHQSALRGGVEIVVPVY